MTTAIQTAKMIYPQQNVAQMILGKMRKRFPERKYEVMKVSSGWQVVGITKCPDYVPPAKPLPVKKTEPKVLATGAVLVAVPLVKECPSYWQIAHSKEWLHKSHVISSSVKDGILRFTTTQKSVEKMQLQQFVETDGLTVQEAA